MTNATRPPDIDGMIGGGQARRRRRNAARVGIAAVAVLALGGGAYGVTQLGDGDAETAPPVANEPSAEPPEAVEPPRYQDLDGTKLEPGTYRKFVGHGESGPINADITFAGDGWAASNHPVVFDDPFAAGLGIYVVEGVARGTGCENDNRRAPAADTPEALAEQLAGLPRSTVLEAPAPTQVLALDAVHLRLRIDDQCRSEGTAYRPVETQEGGRGISYFSKGTPAVEIIDFWVFEVDGTTVVLDTFRHPGTPDVALQQVREASESITLVTDEQ